MVEKNDQINCSLLTGKSRMVLVKYTSIPWLELTAATLSIKMSKTHSADYGSKGLDGTCLAKVKMWYEGPKFLWEPESWWKRDHTAEKLTLVTLRGRRKSLSTGLRWQLTYFFFSVETTITFLTNKTWIQQQNKNGYKNKAKSYSSQPSIGIKKARLKNN